MVAIVSVIVIIIVIFVIVVIVIVVIVIVVVIVNIVLPCLTSYPCPRLCYARDILPNLDQKSDDFHFFTKQCSVKYNKKKLKKQ